MRVSRVLAHVAPTRPRSGRPHSAPRVMFPRRHVRRAERRPGAARSGIDGFVPAATRLAAPGAVDTQTSHTEQSPHAGRNGDVRTRAVQLGLLGEEQSEAFARPPNEGVLSSKDPLLEFLEKNEEDAALLLAMWTSLRRSCLYASEISESLSLNARWFLHYLIRMRAIAAAVRFYQRLLALGVQLHKWDVIVLLKNLPYERSTTLTELHADACMRKEHFSSRIMKQTRERRQEDGDVTWPPKEGVSSRTCSAEGDKTAESQDVAVNVADLTTFPSHVSRAGQVDNSGHTGEELVTGAPCPVLRRPLCQQPVWVKRWVLYEASMGNIDFPHDETLPPVFAPALSKPDSQESAEVDEEMLSASLEANSIIEVTAFLTHLMLLQGAWNTSLLKKKGRKKRREQQQQQPDEEKRQSLFAMYSLQSQAPMGCSYWAEALRVASAYLKSRMASQHITSSLPREFLNLILQAVVYSDSWRVSFHYLQTAQRYGVELCEKDYAKFVLLALEVEPWRKNHVVEQFMASHVVPRFSDTTAAGYALQAIWLAHTCSVKPDRPEDYMKLLGESSNNLPAAIKQTIVFAKLAVSHLRIEVCRHRAQTAARQVLSASVRAGLFSHAGEQTDSNLNGRLPEPINGSSSSPVTGALLSECLKDSFLLVCIGLVRAVVLAPIVVASRDDSLQLCVFLADALYSPTGLWGIFSDLYLAQDHNAARQAPERAFIAASMALCVLRIVLTLCVAHAQFASRPHGISLITSKQLTLFLGMVVEALRAVPSHAAGTRELRSCMRSLARTAAKLTKELCCFLKLSANSEKLLFECISEETVEPVVLMVRILLLLHQDAPGRRFPLTTQLLLWSLLQRGSGLGKQVRRCLQEKEVRQLNSLLNKRVRGRRKSHDSSSLAPSLRTFTPEDIARIERIAKMHQMVYAVVLCHENSPSALEQELISRLHTMQADEALLLVQVALYHLRLHPGTFGTPFFVTVMERLRCGAMGKTSGAVSWLKAVAVYWDAVEHTTRRFVSSRIDATSPKKSNTPQKHEREVLSALLLPMMRLSMASKRRDVGWTWLDRWVSLYAVAERDLRWAMLNIQARSALRDRRALEMCLKLHHKEWREKNVMASADLPPDPLTALLCKVAAEHANWRAALDSLLQPFAGSSTNGNAFALLPPLVATSALRIMCRAPINLSNTALRLRTVQGDQWDLQGANGLLLLLVRQRRWHLALQHVAEMLPALDMNGGVSAGESSANDGSCGGGQTKTVQAFFLLYALRACAIGGCGEEAAALYDRIKALLQGPCAQDVVERTTSNDHVQRLEEALFSASDVDSGAENSFLVTEESEKMRAIASQARLYFFRAMTKKSLVLHRRQK